MTAAEQATLSDIYRSTQFDSIVHVGTKMRGINMPADFSTVQQALLEVRVVGEELNSVSKSDKVYGRGDVADKLEDLAAVASAMASALRAKDEFEVRRMIDTQDLLSLQEVQRLRNKKRRLAKTA